MHENRWWLLYAIFPLSVGLLWLDGRLTLVPQAHQLFEIGIVLLSFGCMALWARGQPAAPAKESAPPTEYFVVPDPNCSEPLDLTVGAPDWHNLPPPAIHEQTPFDSKGRYN